MIKAIFLDLHGVVSNEWHILRNYWHPAYEKYLDYETIRERYWKAKVGDLSFEEMFPEVPKEKLFDYKNKIKLHKGAKVALEALHKNYPLYIASDQVPGFFEKEIEVLGIEKYFKKLFVSYKLRAYKPNQDFFEKILNLQTAKGLGFATVWVNNYNDKKGNEINYKPDYEIKDLKDLIKIVEDLNKKK